MINVDICLMDNAAQMNEYESIPPLIFNPKVYLLFGDHRLKARDPMNFETRYAHLNVNQSLFQRLLHHKEESQQIILNLNTSFRFGVNTHAFLNYHFYNNNMARERSETRDGYPFIDFRNFHHDRGDAFMIELLKSMFMIAHPSQYKYVIVVPPKVDPLHDINRCIDE